MTIPPRQNLRGALTVVTGMMGRAANQIVVLLVTLLAARWLNPTTFGVYAIAAALITFTRSLLYAGAFEYLLKAKPGEEAATECLVIKLILAALMFGLLMTLSLFTTALFHSPEVSGLLVAMAPSNFLSAGSAWQEAQLLRANRVRTYYGVTTFAEILAALVTVVMILLHFGLLALVVQLYVRAFVLLVSYRALQKPIWSNGFSMRLAWRVGRWSFTRYGTTLINFVSNYSADVLLGAYLSPAATGLYRAGNRIVTGVSDLISNPTRTMAMTVFSNRAANGLDSRDIWPRIAGASALVGWTALVGMAAVSDRIVPIVLGAKWTAAAPVITVLCLRRAFALMDGVSNPLLVAYGRVRSLFTVQLAMAIAGVLLLTLFARFGVVAAAWTTVVVAAVSMAICAFLALRMTPVPPSGLLRVAPVAFGPPAAAGLAAIAVNAVIGRELTPIGGLALEIAAGGAAWALMVFANRPSVLEALHAFNATSQPVPSTVDVAV